jgi:hypothetical protein
VPQYSSTITIYGSNPAAVEDVLQMALDNAAECGADIIVLAPVRERPVPRERPLPRNHAKQAEDLRRALGDDAYGSLPLR